MSLRGALDSGERAARRLTRLANGLGPRADLYRALEAEIAALEPWYQPIDFGGGVVAPAVDKSGRVHSPRRSFDRGLGKWRRFVEPALPYPLQGRRVLEVGCNAGMLLVECLRSGAREAVGLELDEHYYRQARFVADALSRLRGGYVPLRVYRGAMERVEWPLLGRFDVGLLLQVIYHLGRARGERSLGADETFAEQVDVVRGLAGVCEYVVFGANPLTDEGFGKGASSLRAIVDAAGLTVASESSRQHPRGYVLVARGAQPAASLEDAPVDRLVNKYFVPAAESAERALAEGDADLFRRLRTGHADWREAGRLPEGLDVAPEYWVVPWAVRPRRPVDAGARERQLPSVLDDFDRLAASVLERGLDPERRIRAFKLVHPERGVAYQYTDGNRRVGIAAALGLRSVPVVVDLEVRRERLLDYPLTRQLVDEGRFTEADAYRWFDQAFRDLP